MVRRTVAELSEFSRRHLGQIACKECARKIECDNLPYFINVPHVKNSARGLIWNGRGDACRKFDDPIGCIKATHVATNRRSGGIPSQSDTDISESNRFQLLAQELKELILWEYLQLSGHRAWVHDKAFLQNGTVQYGFSSRAPHRRTICCNTFYKNKAFKDLGLLEIKRKDSDPTGIIFDPLRDIIFLEQTMSPRSTGLQLADFVAALKRCNAQDKLRSISIGHKALRRETASPARTASILSEFSKLELILIAYNRAPTPRKDSNTRDHVIISHSPKQHPDLSGGSLASAFEGAIEKAWREGLGGLVPHIVHVVNQEISWHQRP